MVEADSALPRWARSWLNRREMGEARIVRYGNPEFKLTVWLERCSGEPWQLWAAANPEADHLTTKSPQWWRLSDPRHPITRFAVGSGGSGVWSFHDPSGAESGWWQRQPLPHWGQQQRLPRWGHVDEAPPALRVPGLPSGYWYGGIDVGTHMAAVGMAVGDEVLVYRVPTGGEGTEVGRYPPQSIVKAVSPDGRFAAISHTGQSTPLRPALDVLDLTTGDVVRRLPPARAVYHRAAQFSRDSTRLVFQEERGGWQGLSLLDLVSGDVHELPIALDRPADLEAIWLPRPCGVLRRDLFTSGEFDRLLGNRTLSLAELDHIDISSLLDPPSPEPLLIVARHGMTTSFHRYELESGACEALSRQTLSYLPYGEGEIAQPTVDSHNGQATFLSSIDGKLELATVNVFGSDNESSMLTDPVETMIPRVAGGEPEIPIRVHKPQGEPPPGGYPMVVLPHGGPHLQDWDGHDDTVKALTESGYLVITVNYRGSTGYGADWIEALLDNPGFGELEDIAAAREWAISEGLADPNRCAIMGASWGGYLALLAAGTQPGLWQAAIAHAARVDLEADYDLLTPTMRRVVTHRYGGTPTEKPEVYRKCSPITYADRLTCPVRITVGDADARAFVGPIDDFARRAEQAGKHVEVKVIDAGHVIGDARTSVAVMLDDTTFLAECMPEPPPPRRTQRSGRPRTPDGALHRRSKRKRRGP